MIVRIRTINQLSTISLYTIGTCTLISVLDRTAWLLRFVYSLPGLHHAAASLVSCSGIPRIMQRHPSYHAAASLAFPVGFERTRAMQESLRHAPSTHSYLSYIVTQPSQSSLCCPRSPFRHLSNLTSLYPVPALHLLT